MERRKELKWVGTSKEDLKTFPKLIVHQLCTQLHALQRGEMPLDGKPVKTAGKGVFELRAHDASGQYRVMYVLIVKGHVHVLHCFQKKTPQTSKHDLEVTAQRLAQIRRQARG